MSAYCSTIEDEPTELDLVYEQLWLTQTLLKARAEEIKAAYERIAELTATLAECCEYLDAFADVRDGDNGEQKPNRAMQLMTTVEESLHGPEHF